MDRELAAIFKSGPHGSTEQFMSTALMLPSCEIGIRYARVYIVKVTTPVWLVTRFSESRNEIALRSVGKLDRLPDR
jgi:hypothetical protein